jgi:hypothetical protein
MQRKQPVDHPDQHVPLDFEFLRTMLLGPIIAEKLPPVHILTLRCHAWTILRLVCSTGGTV